MSLFGKSLEEKVTEAVNTLRAKTPGLKALTATVDGKTVTLEGEADSLAVKALVKPEKTSVPQLHIPAPDPAMYDRLLVGGEG